MQNKHHLFQKQPSSQQIARSLSVSVPYLGKRVMGQEPEKNGRSEGDSNLATPTPRQVYCVSPMKSLKSSVEVSWDVWPVTFREGSYPGPSAWAKASQLTSEENATSASHNSRACVSTLHLILYWDFHSSTPTYSRALSAFYACIFSLHTEYKVLTHMKK